jgi:hypothetical protein
MMNHTTALLASSLNVLALVVPLQFTMKTFILYQFLGQSNHVYYEPLVPGSQEPADKKKKTHKSHLLLPMQICGLQPWLGFSIA